MRTKPTTGAAELPDALRLAALLEKTGAQGSLRDEAATELRRLHAQVMDDNDTIIELRAQVEALSAAQAGVAADVMILFQSLETACDKRSALTSQEAYNALTALPGMEDVMEELDDARRKMRALLAAAPQPVTEAQEPVDSLRTDALRDLSYCHGVKAGWNFCATDDEAGYARAMDATAEALRTLKQTHPAPAQHVAYLDLGAGGYIDLGTDLSDEALAALPKGRHMLVIAGTYGVDGYQPASAGRYEPMTFQHSRNARRLRLAFPRRPSGAATPFAPQRRSTHRRAGHDTRHHRTHSFPAQF